MTKVTRLTLDQSGGLERRRVHLREISDDADMPLETVGQDLRAARQRKGEDLATVSKALKIRKDHLEALEESNFEKLPGRAYALGFVRTYAEYLGLNGPACTERFKAEIAGRDSGADETVKLSVPDERKWPQGSIVFVVLLVIAAIYGGYYLSVSADRMLAEPVTPVPDRLASQADLAPDDTTSTTTTDAAPDTTDTQTQAAAPAATPAPVAPASPASKIQTAALPPPAASPAPTATPPATASTEAAPLPQGRDYGAQNTGSRIALRIHKPTRILVQGPGNAVFLNRTLLPGDTYHAPNLVGLSLTTPDGGAVEVILDGTSLGYVGRTGVISEGLSLNPQAIVDRFNDSHAQSG
jgi:cytoskeleton protein RodZ